MSILGMAVSTILRTSMFGLKRGWHLTRYSMYRSLHQIGERLAKNEGDVLSISQSRIICEVMGFKPINFFEANYPAVNILSLPYNDNSFDFVCSDQVLEHVDGNPQQAINECWRVLRPNGITVHTSCFINPVHNEPGDYWRFTPDALCLLSNKFKKIISYGAWGNFHALLLIRCDMRFDRVPHASWHPFNKIATKNDPLWPIVTWIVAEK